MKKKRVFVDKDHEARAKFTLVAEDPSLDESVRVTRVEQLIKDDPGYYDPYNWLFEYHEQRGEIQLADAWSKRAYEHAFTRILDDLGRLPDRLEDDRPDNGHILRALNNRGLMLWSQHKASQALDILRNVLRLDPSDPVNAGHAILAIRLGFTREGFTREFGSGEDIDIDDMSEWFASEEINYPDEFWDEMFTTEHGPNIELEEEADIELESRSGQAHVPRVFQLKISLKRAKPPVWRRILLLDTGTFAELHEAIQEFFSWGNEHLHDFEVTITGESSKKKKIVIEGYTPDGDVPDSSPDGLLEDQVQLRDFLSIENPKAMYRYDFGENIVHLVTLEKVIAPVKGETYPNCIKSKGDVSMDEDEDEGEEAGDSDETPDDS